MPGVLSQADHPLPTPGHRALLSPSAKPRGMQRAIATRTYTGPGSLGGSVIVRFLSLPTAIRGILTSLLRARKGAWRGQELAQYQPTEQPLFWFNALAPQTVPREGQEGWGCLVLSEHTHLPSGVPLSFLPGWTNTGLLPCWHQAPWA